MDRGHNFDIELAQLFDVIRVNDDGEFGHIQTVDDINKEVFLLICKYSREYATLVVKCRHEQINENDFKKQRGILFHKLLGQYNATLHILKLGIPLDIGIFESVIVNDMSRMSIFESFKKEDLSAKDYLIADNFRIGEVLNLYGERIIRMKKNNEHINDHTFIFT